MSEFRRLDVLQLPTMTKDKDGFLVGEAVITRTGIFKYKKADGSIVNELRHPHDVFDANSLASLRMLPIALMHPPEAFITVQNAKDRQIGQTGENVRIDRDVVIVPIKITHADAIKEIEKGIRDISMGYTVQHDDLDGGMWENEKYDYKQINIRYNHLAVVPDGRAGVARLNLDATDAIMTDEESTKQSGGTEMADDKKQLPKVVIDSISYEASPEVINALEKEKKRADSLQEQLKAFSDIKLNEDGDTGKAEASVITAFQTLQGKHDALQKKLDEAEEKVTDEAIQKAVAVRSGLIETAKKVLDEETIKKLDELTDLDIMKEVIVQSVNDEAEQKKVRDSLAEAAEPYIKGSFDIAIKSIPDNGRKAVADQRRQIHDQSDKTDQKDTRSSEDARADMLDRMQKDHLPKEKA